MNDAKGTKKSVFKKWWFWLLTAIAVIAIAGSAGGNDGSNQTASNTQPQTSAQGNQSAQAKQNNTQVDTGNVGDYKVTIKSAKIGKEAFGNRTAVTITYDFTNNSDEAANFMTAIYDIVYQNGIQLESTIAENDADNWMKNIQKGATLEVTRSYVLQDTANPIEVEITEYLGFNNDKITKTFNLQ